VICLFVETVDAHLASLVTVLLVYFVTQTQEDVFNVYLLKGVISTLYFLFVETFSVDHAIMIALSTIFVIWRVVSACKGAQAIRNAQQILKGISARITHVSITAQKTVTVSLT